MRRGIRTETPLPTRLVSNEEFPALPQTAEQRAVEERIFSEAGRLAPRLGLTRRSFLATTGGMATSLLAMNAVFGRFFDVLPVEAAEQSAFKERSGDPFFIFDAQLHYVSSAYQGPFRQPLLGLRGRSKRLNPKLASDTGTMADLAWSDVGQGGLPRQRDRHGPDLDPARSVSSGSAAATEGEDPHPRRDQPGHRLAAGTHPRAPHARQLGQVDLDFMDQQAAQLKVDAWKGYTGAPAQGFDRGWFADDQKIAYPMLRAGP